MIRPLPLFLPVLTLLLPLLPAQEPEKVHLAVHAKKGDAAAFVARSKQEQSIDMGGQMVDGGHEVTHDLALKVVDVADDGTVVAEILVQRVRGSFTLPMMGDIEFDTNAPADGKAADDASGDSGFGLPSAGMLRKAMGQLTGKAFTAKVAAGGGVKEFDGLAPLLEAARKEAGQMGAQMLSGTLSEGALKQVVGSLFGALPKDNLATGVSWPGEEDYSDPQRAPMERKTTMTVAKVDDEVAEITVAGTITSKPKEAGGEPEAGDDEAAMARRMMQDAKVENGKITGSMVVSRKDGLVVRAESKATMDVTVSSPMGEMKIGVRSTTTVERAQPAAEAKDAK